MDVRVVTISSTEIAVGWDEIPENTKYEVLYQRLDEDLDIDDDMMMETSVFALPPSTSVRIDGLDKFTVYAISVRAWNELGSSKFSQPLQQSTLEDGKLNTGLSPWVGGRSC